MFPTTCLQAPSDTQPQYGSLDAIQDLDVTNTETVSPLILYPGVKSPPIIYSFILYHFVLQGVFPHERKLCARTKLTSCIVHVGHSVTVAL